MPILRRLLFPFHWIDLRFYFGIYRQEKTSRKNWHVLYLIEVQRLFRGNRPLLLQEKTCSFYRSADLFCIFDKFGNAL